MDLRLRLLPFLCRLPAFPTEPVVATGLNWIVHSEATTHRWQNATVSVMHGVNILLFACLGGWIGHFILIQWRAAPGGAADPQRFAATG